MVLTLQGSGPLYTQVYGALYRAIAEGRLRVGKRLPGTRTLARELGVSRTVVLQAYAQLDSEGITASNPGSGTYVHAAPAVGTMAPAPIAPEAPGPSAVRALPPLSHWARLALESLPASTDEAAADAELDLASVTTVQDERGQRLWRRAVIETFNTRFAEVPDVQGLPSLRQVLAEYLRDERGVLVQPDHIMIVGGIQQARDLIARVLVETGGVIGIEDPCYRGIRATFRGVGATVVPCAVGDQGFDITRHAGTLAGARLLYLMPSYQFPTGVTMSRELRIEVLEWAYRQGVYLVEDDFEADHHFGASAAPPLFALDSREQVIYMGSFAREYFPFIRLAYLIVPPALRPYFHAAKWLADRGSGTLAQRALGRYIGSGDYTRNLRRLYGAMTRRRQWLAEALRRHLGERAWSEGAGASGSLLLHLPEVPATQTSAFLQCARAQGVQLQAADVYYAVPPEHLTLLVRYVSLSPGHLDEAVRRIARTCDAMLAWRMTPVSAKA